MLFLKTSKFAGASSTLLQNADGDFWYSYQTLIAFQKIYGPLVIRQNDFSSTTGKHLNAIDPDKSVRVSYDEFERLYHETFEGEKS